MHLEIFGARGSYPVSGREFIEYGGNTTSILINTDNISVIIDAGTGIINLSKSQKLRQKVYILFTHYHFDHIIGLPYASFIYSNKVDPIIYGPSILDVTAADVVNLMSLPVFSPFNIIEKGINLSFNAIKDGDTIGAGSLKITAIHSPAHPRGGVLIYKIEEREKSVVVATDTEGYVGGDKRLIDLSFKADILIHDAQYTEEEYPKHQGYGHSTPRMAAEVALSAEVKKLILFHHDPSHTDTIIREKEKRARKIFPETTAAYEGMALEL